MNRLIFFAITLLLGFALVQNSVFAQQCKPLMRASGIPSETTYKKMAEALEYYSNDEIEKAIATLKAIQPNNISDRAYINRLIGNLYSGIDEEHYKSALPYLRDAVAADVLSIREHLATIRLVADLSLMLNNQEQQAIDYYQMWLDKSCEQNAVVYERMAHSAHKMEQYEAVLKYAKQAIAITPSKNAYALAKLASYEFKRYADAAEYSRLLYEIEPENKQHKADEIQFYVVAEQYQKAMDLFLEANKTGIFTLNNSSDITLFRMMAHSFLSAQQYPIAFYLFQVILPKSESQEADLTKMINALSQSTPQNVDIVLDSINRFIDESKQAQLYNKLSGRLISLNSFEQAIAILQQALNFNDLAIEVDIRTNLASAYYQLGDDMKAQQELDKAYEISNVSEYQQQQRERVKALFDVH